MPVGLNNLLVTGGLLSAVANFYNNANQAFTTAVAVKFQDGRFFPAAGPFEVLVATDDTFTPQVADAVWRIAWSLGVGNTGGASATVQVDLEVGGTPVAGTLKVITLPAGENREISAEAFVSFPGPVDSFQLIVERISGTGTPQVNDDQAVLIVERVTASDIA